MITSSPGLQLTGVATSEFRRHLHRIEHAEDLVEVATGGHGIRQHQLDFLVGADHEDPSAPSD